jgi:hypothetical protein
MSSALNGVRRALTQRAKAATTGGVRGFQTSAPKRYYPLDSHGHPVSNPYLRFPGAQTGRHGRALEREAAQV